MTTFESLSARRRAYVDAARNNGFEEGLRNLLANLYPDNAHFIYEILQNAEDAGAHEVNFDLRSNGLRVQHDGSRLFDLRDIDSITGIGQSTKADDATSIGKFGVGFKAVFAYTQTPEIHSGEHSFAIHDLFVPTAVPRDVRDGWTSFWFPFDRADKPAQQAVVEVASALREISRTTLLFLNNITLIGCSLPDGDERLLERRALDTRIISIESIHETGGPAYWYRIAGDVDIDGNSLPVAAAFALERHAPKGPGPTKYSIMPIAGQVFIYFPAVNETSGLKFHVHAPFASTVARDNVRDDPGNQSLVEGIANVIADALPSMRDAGLLTDGLFSALPNKDDVLPHRYTAIRVQVTTAFNSESLAPTVDGENAPAKELLRAESNLYSTLSIEDAKFLGATTPAVQAAPGLGWLKSGKGRVGAFLDSLDAVDFGRDEITSMFKTMTTSYQQADVVEVSRKNISIWNDWISPKSDTWLREFYLMLQAFTPRSRSSSRPYDQPGHDLARALIGVPIIRVQYGRSVRHISGEEGYLPTAVGLRADGLVIDSLAVFENDNDAEGDVDNRELRAFYEQSKVRPWDAAARLDECFKMYGHEPASVTYTHLRDLSSLKQLLETKAVAPSTYRGKAIFVAVRSDGTPYWAAPQDLYIDEPFAPTGLSSLYDSATFAGPPPGRLSAEYVGKSPDAGSLAQTLQAITGLRITQLNAWNNPNFETGWRYDGRENQNMTSIDWTIPNLRLIISTGDEQLLRTLWRVVTTSDTKFGEALYRSNLSTSIHRFPSTLLMQLKSSPWILDRDGNGRVPADMTEDDLPPDLFKPANATLLDLAGFGRNAASATFIRKVGEERARSLGFKSSEELQLIVDAYKESPEEILEWIRDRKQSLPDAPSAAPGQRASRAGELARLAPTRTYDNRVRSVYVQVPGHRSAARIYLTQLYTNEDGTMLCQICLSAMPFKVDGGYYFEAVQFVKDTALDLLENRLSLCPTCAAKYRHARDTSLEDLRDDLLTQTVGNQGSVAVEIVLAGEPGKLRFGGKHAIDLQAALRAMETGRIDDDMSND
ncbi:sacsin N-terminal ATP-binding-like domain-containing protein [Cryobacterium sp. N19]|uniref:sacsin N-terminal ATP-binding-like domain-containing protein n=1 Tax=Cryobacterium sp. N19 TaxID=2048288 RepID=UPI000CE4CE2B|nr:hypothetical protein [Cryobacterium sp. N19]